MTNIIRALKLRGTDSATKFIPEHYLRASWEDRLELMAGLLDTDGYLEITGAGYDYVTKSNQLARDVVFLAGGLGLKVSSSVVQRYDQNGHGGDYHRIRISGAVWQVPCRVARKMAPFVAGRNTQTRVAFDIVQLAEAEDYYGFTLDGDGRYLLADFTVTHNTTTALAFTRALLGASMEDGNFLALNASSERGIAVIQERVVPWLGQAPADGAPFKVLFLDEADQLTRDAQSALRSPMEEYSETTRFILAVNNPNQLIDPIQSRCLPLAFRPLTREQMNDLLVKVGKDAGIPDDATRRESAVANARGDARRALTFYVNRNGGGDLWVRIDQEFVRLFDTTTPATKEARIVHFIEFLREEGVTEWEGLLIRMTELTREKNLIAAGTPQRAQFHIDAVGCARDCGLVADRLFQVQGFLWRVVP